MTQASQNKPATTTPAPAATIPPAGAKPADAKPADAKPADAKPADAVANGANGASEADDDKKRNASKIYVVVGEVHEFETAAKAEKFLNGTGAPTNFAVLRGKRIDSRRKVSLR